MRYQNAKQKFGKSSSDFTENYWRSSLDCNYSDLKHFISYTRSLSVTIDTFGDGTNTLASDSVAIYFPSFYTFCDLFRVSSTKYESLRVIARKNRKKELTSFKVIGSVLEDASKIHLPTIICIGGNPSRWCDDNLYVVRENSHRLQNETVASQFKKLQPTAFPITSSQLSHKSGSTTHFKWTILPTTDICRPDYSDTSVMGTLQVSIPYIVFHNIDTASQIFNICDSKKTRHVSDGSSDSDSNW